jgi:hypothetical protein
MMVTPDQTQGDYLNTLGLAVMPSASEDAQPPSSSEGEDPPAAPKAKQAVGWKVKPLKLESPNTGGRDRLWAGSEAPHFSVHDRRDSRTPFT